MIQLSILLNKKYFYLLKGKLYVLNKNYYIYDHYLKKIKIKNI